MHSASKQGVSEGISAGIERTTARFKCGGCKQETTGVGMQVGFREAVQVQEGDSASGVAFGQGNHLRLRSVSHIPACLILPNLRPPSLSDILATALFSQTLAVKVCLSGTAGKLSSLSSVVPTLSFAYQSAREKSSTNCCPPKGSQVLLLTSIFRLIPFASFFHCATFCQISAQRKFLQLNFKALAIEDLSWE